MRAYEMANQQQLLCNGWIGHLPHVVFLYMLALAGTLNTLSNGVRAETWLTEDEVTNIYIRSLIKASDADNDDVLSRQELSNLLEKTSCWGNSYSSSSKQQPGMKEGDQVPAGILSTQGEGRGIVQPYNSKEPGSDICADADWMNKSQCLTKKCLKLDNIWQIFTRDGDGKVDGLTLRNLLPAVFYQYLHQNCSHKYGAKNKTLEDDIGAHSHKPSTGKAWGYGIGFVTLINVISNVGALMIPIMEKSYFKRVLMFMVSLAVGSMAATSILVLTPEAYNLMNDVHTQDDYLWKAGTIVLTIYAFFLTERLIAVVTQLRQPSGKGAENGLLDNATKSPPNQELELMSSENTIERAQEKHAEHTAVEKHGHGHGLSVSIEQNDTKGQMTSLALMLLTGDGIHKTMDGLAIGVAFTENVFLGVSVSLAIVSEELPHELGDIAVLLHSGLSIKRSLIYNCFAAVFSYIGLVIGVLLGENTDANRWIFAMAGGMFLYVSLVVLLPEVNRDANSEESKKFGLFKVFMVQNAGIVIGFLVIFIIANFVGQLSMN